MNETGMRVWLAVTEETGDPLSVFSSHEAAMTHYGVTAVVSGTEGVMNRFGFRNMTGVSWAYPSLTAEETEALFGNAIKRPQFFESRWLILIWDPVSESHSGIVLRPMDVK